MTVAEQILDALGEVGMDLVDMSENQQFPKSFLRRTLPVAACVALMLTGGIMAQRYLTADPGTPAAQPFTAQPAAEPISEDFVSYTLREQGETILLSSQSSAYVRNEARERNLTLACEAIDGMVLEPGTEFSFNAAVGERTEEKGYMAASTYSDGEGVSEVGGGIGQVASMLYCASLKMGLDQLERAGNTYAVSYVPMGFDAAVYWDVTDYRFANSLETAIEIRAVVENGLITVELWGQPEEAQSIELESVLIADNVVETYQLFLDENGDVLRKDSIGITRYEEREP